MSTFTIALQWNVTLATVLAITVGLMSRLKVFQRRPAVSHALWLLVLARLIAPPCIPVPVLPGDTTQKAAEQAGTTPNGPLVAAHPPTQTVWLDVERLEASPAKFAAVANPVESHSWFAALIATSAFGTLVLVSRCLSQYLRVSRILCRANNGEQRFAAFAHAAAARMGLRRIPLVCTTDACIAPLLWVQPNAPVIVLPTSLVERMNEEQISCIFYHELAHYLRRDHWSNMFAFAVTSLFWWHPVAWWARREMRAAQEVCCDDLALAAGGANRRCYAETLFQALDFLQSRQVLHPTLASGFGSSSSFRRRIEMIAAPHVTRTFSRCAAPIVAVCIAAMLCRPVPAQVNSEKRAGWEETSTIQLEHAVAVVACNTDWLAIGDAGGNLFVSDVKTRQSQKVLFKGGQEEGHSSSIDRLQFNFDGTNLYAVVQGRKAAFQLHLKDDPEKPSPGIMADEPFFFGFSADCEYWLELHASNKTLALRPNLWTQGNSTDYKSIRFDSEITHAVISADDKALAVVTADAKLHMYDREALVETYVVDLSKQLVRAIQFSPDGKQIAVVGERTSKVYDTTSGNEVATFKGHEGTDFAVAFSPDGKLIVTGGDDNCARIWEAATGKPLAVLSGHKNSITTVAFDLNGETIFTGSADKTVKTWSRRQGNE